MAPDSAVRRRASFLPLPPTQVAEGADQPFCLEMVAYQASHERRPSTFTRARLHARRNQMVRRNFLGAAPSRARFDEARKSRSD